MRILLEGEGDGRDLTVELDVSEDGDRVFKVNGVSKRRLIDVRGIIPSVVFTPDDLRMVKGPAEKRRSAIDSVGQQISPAYGSLRREYERTLRQRNALLKESVGKGLEEWTEKVADTGARLTAHRIRLLARLATEASAIHGVMTDGQRLVVEYAGSWGEGPLPPDPLQESEPIREKLLAALSRVEAEERARGVTLVGPHRDDVVFSIEGHEARTLASQGQQRTIALSMKLAEVDAIKELASSPPVLLLDDVMSELDESRRSHLTRFVGEWAQTVITATGTHYFTDEILADATVIKVGE